MLASLAACGGGSGAPSGAQRNYVPATTPPLTNTQQVQFSISLPAPHISNGSQSVAVVLAAVNGQSIPAQSPTVVAVSSTASNCSPASNGYTCTATVEGASGVDAFNVTFYSQPNAGGQVLSTGTVFAPIGGANSNLNITNAVAISLFPIATGLQMLVTPSSLNVGTAAQGAVVVQPVDGSGAIIASGVSGNVSLSMPATDGTKFSKGPSTSVPLYQYAPFTYNGSTGVTGSALTIAASLQGSSPQLSSTANIPFKFPPTPTPSPTPSGLAPAIYVLNQGQGSAPTVTVYPLSASGNAAPIRTINLDPNKVVTPYSAAVDGSGNLYVGFINASNFGEIDVFAYNATGSATPIRTILSDPNDHDPLNDTTLNPVQLAIGANGALLTIGSTQVSGNNGNTAALVYAAGASGKAVPIDGWNFTAPQISTSGQAQASVGGLALDTAGNYYVAGALKSGFFSSVLGIFSAPATASGPSVAATPLASGPPLPQTPSAGSITGLALDSSGTIYESQFIAGQTTFTGTINVYAAASANLKATISDPNDLTINPQLGLTTLPVAVNGQQIYVANGSTNGVFVYPTSANGNTTPLQTITGSNTGLNTPISIAVGFSGP